MKVYNWIITSTNYFKFNDEIIKQLATQTNSRYKYGEKGEMVNLRLSVLPTAQLILPIVRLELDYPAHILRVQI